MIYYTPEMFDIRMLEETLKPSYMQKETIEFKLKQFQTNFDTFKKINYEELLIYERKKELDSNTIPSKVVLQQIKLLETDDAAKEFKQIISSFKRDLKNLTISIDNEYRKINDKFSFTEKNLKRYLTELNKFYNGEIQFNELMEDIFNNEFNEKQLYYILASQRIYDVLFLIVEKAPTEWQHIMRLIYDEMYYEFIKEEISFVQEFGDDYNKIMVLIRNKYVLQYGLE